MNDATAARRRPLILFYNNCFDDPFDLTNFSERVRNCCVFDRSLYEKADAAIFHIPDLTFGQPNLEDVARLNKADGQLWVAWSMESSVNYPALSDPSFMARFDLTMTYRRSADFWMPYCPDRSTWNEALRRPLPAKTAAAPLVMFQSAPFNKYGRAQFAGELMKEIQVDSFGRFLNNKSLPGPDHGRQTKLDTIARYKFCLSLENSIEEDYVTEKFYDPLLAGVAPVYRGAPNIDEFAPGEHCYIDASKFTSPRELAEYLHYLDKNTDAYNAYFAWRDRPLRATFESEFLASRPNPFEALVDAVERRLSKSSG